MSFCAGCGVVVSATHGVCPLCRTVLDEPRDATIRPASDTDTRVSIGERMTAAIAYFTPVPAVVLLLLGLWRGWPLCVFHAVQSLLFHLVFAVGAALLALVVTPAVSAVAALILWPLYAFAGFILVCLLVIKALLGEIFQLPGIGGLALRASGF